jgi:dipeptidase
LIHSAGGGTKMRVQALAIVLLVGVLGTAVSVAAEEMTGTPWPRTPDRCTSIAVGKDATVDGSVMNTHTADCEDCDWRVNKVPARDWEDGAMRPIYLLTGTYPIHVREDRGFTWSKYNLENMPQFVSQWEQMTGEILGYIPQVSHTYALVEGQYGIMNEHQVAIGESTCPTKIWAAPMGSGGGKALLEASELSQIALERSKTAREAIQLMGDLAVQFGFYSAEWDLDNPIGKNPSTQRIYKQISSTAADVC